MKKAIYILLGSASLFLPSRADNPQNILDIKSEITDSNIIFPESYESDTQKMLEGWYLKNYTATDTRYKTEGDVQVSDATLRKRLAALPTVIDMPYNSIVRSYIERYTSRARAQVSALLGLSIYYMPIFEQALEEEGLPLELKYLPVIESALNPNAVSKHGAAGLWQFMIATGKGMGLEVSSLVDERRDPYLSSKVAAKFLKNLYDSYGDWTLAIAAYNCGPGAVNKALRRAGGDAKSHDFWSIYYYLSPETRGYIPQFIAANYVMNYHKEHNISPVLPTKPLVTDTLHINNRVHLQQISQVLDIPVEEIRTLNPQFRADIIPGNAEHSYTLILPSQQIHAYIMSEEDILAYEAEKYLRRINAEPGDQPSEVVLADMAAEDEQDFAEVQAELESARNEAGNTITPGNKPTAKAGEKTYLHKVAAGESLSDIASKYEVTPQQIKDWNGLRRNAVRTGQMLKVNTTPTLAKANGAREAAGQTDVASSAPQSQPKEQSWSNPKNNRQNSSSSASKQSSKNTSSKQAKPTTHTVKSGENLTVIAKKYGTTVDQLRKSSGISGDDLRPGQVLKLPAKASVNSGTGKKTGKGSAKKSGKSKKRKK